MRHKFRVISISRLIISILRLFSFLILIEKGARSVRAFCTHPVLSGNAYENIENSALQELVVCDTIPINRMIDKLKVASVAELFAIAIRNAFENKSINSLFLKSKIL